MGSLPVTAASLRQGRRFRCSPGGAGVRLFLAALAGGLAGALWKTPAIGELSRHLVEGSATYLDVILVFTTATLFMAIVNASGGVNYVVRATIRLFHSRRLIALGMSEFKSRLPAPEYPTDEQLRAIQAPALVVIAGRSIIHEPRRAARRARLLPDAQVELWPDASHALNGEFPDRIADRVWRFLDEC